MSNSLWIAAASSGQRSVIFPGSTTGGLIRLQAMKPRKIKDTFFSLQVDYYQTGNTQPNVKLVLQFLKLVLVVSLVSYFCCKESVMMKWWYCQSLHQRCIAISSHVKLWSMGPASTILMGTFHVVGDWVKKIMANLLRVRGIFPGTCKKRHCLEMTTLHYTNRVMQHRNWLLLFFTNSWWTQWRTHTLDIWSMPFFDLMFIENPWFNICNTNEISLMWALEELGTIILIET